MRRAARRAVAPPTRRGGFVLGSHALLAYFEGEASGALVRTLIQDANCLRRKAAQGLLERDTAL